MALNHDNLESGASLVKLALANYRAQHVNLPESEHADDALLLLKLANEDQAVAQWATALTGAELSELQKSAIYYIEHQCFSSASDVYGILALNPWATLDDLKTHYRLLIRIFHPDRGFVSEQLAEKYSAMINQAYAALKNTMPVQAKITDATNQSRKGISKLVQQELKAAQGKRAWLRLIDLNQISWFTPGKILLACAAISAFSIYYFVMPETVSGSTFEVMRGGGHRGLGYYDESPMSSDAGNDLSEAEITAIKLSKLESRNVDKVFTESSKLSTQAEGVNQNLDETEALHAGTQQAVNTQTSIEEKGAEQKSLEQKQVVQAKGAGLPAPQTKKIPEPPLSNTRLNALRNMNAASVKADPALQTSTVDIFKPIKSASLPEPKPAAALSGHQSELAVAAPVATNKKAEEGAEVNPVSNISADEISPSELRKLLFLFVDGYQRGDIQTFMQVFTDDVKSDEGSGRDNLRQAYIDVFNTTTDREMVVKNMNWEQQGQQLTGNASYAVKIRRNDHDKIKTITGKLRLEVKRVNNQSKINEFYYVADR